MSKSIEEMIELYIDKYISAPENKKLICEALLYEKQRSIEEYSDCFENMEEYDYLLDLDDLLYYDKIQNILYGLCIRAKDLFDKYCEIECDTIEDYERKEAYLYDLLYVYIKLDESALELSLLAAFADDSWYFEESEELKKLSEIFDALKIIMDKMVPSNEQNKCIEFADVVVKTNVFKCNKNHKIEQIQAVVKIVDADGNIVEKSVSAGYCEDCEHYFILEKDFQKLKRYGVLLCRVISEKAYYNNKNSSFDLQAESVLHQVGYNVSSTEGLSTEQRWEILKMVVDSGLYSVSGLCSFLDYLIDKNQRVTTRDMSIAIYKWQIDRDFIAEYEEDSRRKINVNSFKEKIYEELPF